MDLEKGPNRAINRINNNNRIGPIIRIEDPKEAFSIDYIYIEEDTKVEETTMADIATTTHPIRSDATSIINLDTS